MGVPPQNAVVEWIVRFPHPPRFARRPPPQAGEVTRFPACAGTTHGMARSHCMNCFRFNSQTAETIPDAPPRSRGAIAPEVCKNHSPRKTEGVGNAGCATHPQPRVRNKTKHTSVVTTVAPGSPGIPARNGFTAYIVLSPVSEFVLSPSSANIACLSPVGPTRLREFNTSNGCQNHTALPYAESICRPHALGPLTRFMRTRPAIPARARRCRVHRIPPRVNDDGQRPSSGTGRRGI